MKIIKSLFSRCATSNDLNYTVLASISEETIKSYSTYDQLGRQIAQLVASEIYPEVKDKLMQDKEFQKIINEIRLLTAKRFISQD